MSNHDNWDTHWDEYANSASNNPGQQMRHAIVTRFLSRDREPLRLLDIGSGQGDLIAKLRKVFPRVELLGAELSASGVNISRRKVPTATFIEANLFSPPPEFEQFRDWATDAVCSEVLEHVDDPSAFLRAVRPYICNHARLIVTVPGGPMSAFDRHIGHRQHFDKHSITRVLSEAGFTVERVCRSGFPFFNVYRSVVIARGDKLQRDVQGEVSVAASLAMFVFRMLFNFNLIDMRFGWQIVAVAYKS